MLIALLVGGSLTLSTLPSCGLLHACETLPKNAAAGEERGNSSSLHFTKRSPCFNKASTTWRTCNMNAMSHALSVMPMYAQYSRPRTSADLVIEWEPLKRAEDTQHLRVPQVSVLFWPSLLLPRGQEAPANNESPVHSCGVSNEPQAGVCSEHSVVLLPFRARDSLLTCRSRVGGFRLLQLR